MPIVVFTLTMPGVSSWDGRWSGEDKLYAVTRTMKAPDIEKLDESYIYSFGDGWVARVFAKMVDPVAARKIQKKSSGFHGYEWMVESIIQYGEIRSSTR